MSEDQRSDIKGERETMAGSDETKKVACVLWLCGNFVEKLSTWLKSKNNKQQTTINAERGTRTSNRRHFAAPVACSVAASSVACSLPAAYLSTLRATAYATYVYVWLGTCRYVVGSSKICWMSAPACLDASSTGPPVRSRSRGAVGPVDRTGHKIEPGPQPYLQPLLSL